MEHSCVDCAIKKCNTGKGKYPEFCATEHMPDEVLADAMACYEEKENREVSVAAARVEYEHYCQYTRVPGDHGICGKYAYEEAWHCNMRRSVE